MVKITKLLLVFSLVGVLGNCGNRNSTEDIPKAQLQQEAKLFAQDFWQGNLDAAYDKLAPVMQQQLPKEKLNELILSLSEQFGTFVKFSGEPQITRKGEYYPVVLKCTLEEGQVNLQTTFDENFKVAGLFYEPERTAETTEGDQKITNDDLTMAAVKFGNEFWQGNLDSAYTNLAQIMMSNVTTENFGKIKSSVLEQKGRFKVVHEDVKISKKGELYIVILKCDFERGSINMQLTFDKTLKIAGLYFV